MGLPIVGSLGLSSEGRRHDWDKDEGGGLTKGQYLSKMLTTANGSAMGPAASIGIKHLVQYHNSSIIPSAGNVSCMA
jgi:hypothetical protein